ncbi:unnamed protein product [Paramecium pentaurelia]|uniref:MHD domain-containing protein n=1 Tax=Paramecium pentaurelia TaxID=43138 RepID=A0A8S1VNV9_9CILI|nr:unnamed protein product [Paramecium pentaurelia]
MISSLSFINQKGEILIYRVYKDDISRNEITQFCAKMIATKENKEFPIINIDQTSFIHISIKDIIILATTKTDVNVAMVLEFLYQLSKICKSYFQGNLDENCIKKSFVLIYEILDEVLDYGIPQIADPNLLQKFIQEGGVQQETTINIEKLRQLTFTLTGVVSWRPIGLYYEKNELYLDIIESVNLLISAKDTVLRAEVVGSIELKSKLTGMPECQIGMNDKLLMGKQQKQTKQTIGISIDDMKFHPCVRLPKFDKDRTITFIPPDGHCQLISYRISENINIPFKVNVFYSEIIDNKLEIRLKIKSIYDNNIYGTNVLVKVPVPKNTVNAITATALGKARYEVEEQSVIWRIKKFQGDFETSLRCEINLGTTNKDQVWSKPPLKMEFQIPMFTASGLRVRFLKVMEKAGYKTNKWIRYLTKGGEYLHRL